MSHTFFAPSFSQSLCFEGTRSPRSLRDANPMWRGEPLALSAGGAFGLHDGAAPIHCGETNPASLFILSGIRINLIIPLAQVCSV